MFEWLVRDAAVRGAAVRGAAMRHKAKHLTKSAAIYGQWEGLQLLERLGGKHWCVAAQTAALACQLECLQNIVQLDAGVLGSRLLNYAAARGSLACLTFLVEAGCQWHGDVPVSAARSGSADALLFCLQECHHLLQHSDWATAMKEAVISGAPDCMQALYDYGYPCPAAESDLHPARLAIRFKSLACLHLAVQRSGPPQIHQLDLWYAAETGEEMLRDVHSFGGTLDGETAKRAAHAGQVGALQYALQHGAPLSMRTLEAAIEGVSLECLKCAFEHGRAVGLPAASSHGSSYPRLTWWRFTPCVIPFFQVLRYVCEVLRPAWAQQLLFEVAKSFLCLMLWEREKDGWKIFLYMAQKMEGPLPLLLDELVPVRRERARALAGVFHKAKKLVQAGAPSPSLALWGAMDKVPLELRERIAFEAHLICPVTQLGPL
eukprot:jgi/Botrbrau1/2773/Bobra.0164s0050.1